MEHDDDLQATHTEGYKVGEKKSLDEYNKLDENDESLNRWKASLGITGDTAVVGDPDEMRKVVVEGIGFKSPGREDYYVAPPYDTPNSGAMDPKSNVPVIKEGSDYQIFVRFRVTGGHIISGLKYLHAVKRRGIRVDKKETMIGSYKFNTKDTPSYYKEFDHEEAPAGMLARGTYDVTSKFIDDDKVDHFTFKWSFKIEKDWS